MPDHGTDRIILTADPPNAETPLAEMGEPVTRTGRFYVRCHFEPPVVDASEWTVEVSGAVARERTVPLQEIRSLPARTRLVTLECAGNGRRRMDPVPDGTPWDLGAVSTGEFGGAPLGALLRPLGIAPAATEVVFHGADMGTGGERFSRSLPLEVALDPETLLAWELNGAPLLPEHGSPLRLVVPGWYAMASVKWLAAVEVVTEPFAGRFQCDEYVYVGEVGVADGTPVRRMRVRSVIAAPSTGEVVPLGEVDVVGSAWSGAGPVVAVEFSADGGATWAPAELEDARAPYAAQRWRARWSPGGAGAHLLVSRATDAAGNRQPLEPRWNRLGYGNNVCHQVRVTVR